MVKGRKHLHVLGICGTFMGGLALLARSLGYRVTGSDQNVYPPMSTLLEQQGVEIEEGFEAGQLDPAPDLVVVGNAMTRGIPAVEYMLSNRLPYMSGPQWLGEHLLRDRHVLAVAGTHGKTTTTSMLALILDQAGYAPGFLIGGVPANFGVSARLGDSPWFVIEADEYDTAFFDKRSKFLHYHPRTLVLNNLEFDHADIFDDLAAIERQFHHVVRIVPQDGRILSNARSSALKRVLDMGCWSELETFGVGAQDGAERPVESADDGAGALANARAWTVGEADAHGRYAIRCYGRAIGLLPEVIRGPHNAENALAAIAAAHHVGVAPHDALAALAHYKGVARRLEQVIAVGEVVVYDDFAHHPTAVARTLETLRGELQRADDGLRQRRLIAVLEPRSNTMRQGVHGDALARALALADECWIYSPPAVRWSPHKVLAGRVSALHVHEEIDMLTEALVAALQPGDAVVLMSNGAFGGLRQRLAVAVSARFGGA